MTDKLENKYFLYLKLQGIITFRSIKDFGLPPYTFIFFLVFIMFYGIYKICLLEEGVYINLLLFLILRSLCFTHKNDKEIIIANFKNPQTLFLIESGIILFPFFLINLLFQNYLLSAVYTLIAAAYALWLVPVKSFSFLNKLNLSFLMTDYEWIHGIRKYFFVFPISIILLLIAIQSHNANIGLTGGVLLYVLLLQFYNAPEPLILIWKHHMSSHNFISHKLISLSKKLIAAGALLLILYSILSFENLPLSLMLIISMSVSVLNQMLMKYAFYSDNYKLMLYQALSFILGIGALFLYPIIILNIVLFLYLKKEAIKSVKKLLYVEDIGTV